MKSYPAPPIPEDVIADMRARFDAGTGQADLIQAMRDAGLSIIPSIQLLVRFYGLTLAEAKRIVHYSQTWADCREGNDALHEAMVQAAKELGFEESPSNRSEALQTH